VGKNQKKILPTEGTEKHGTEGLDVGFLISAFPISVSFRVFRGERSEKDFAH
jgi:hypothetical protein